MFYSFPEAVTFTREDKKNSCFILKGYSYCIAIAIVVNVTHLSQEGFFFCAIAVISPLLPSHP